MARGQVFSLNSGAATLIPTQSRGERSSVAILNPNDGVVFVKLNAPAGNTPSAWDWKLPSQSYGLFPGPWSSLGLYYADTSGAGLPGELNVYDSDVPLAIPDIRAIGRSVQARSNAMDITEGPQPANPGTGILRLWADATDTLHGVASSGLDRQLRDTQHLIGLADISAGAVSQIVSAGSFASQTTTALTDVFIVGSAFTITPRIAGASILLLAGFSAHMDVAANSAFLSIYRDGAIISNIAKFQSASDMPVFFGMIDTPTAAQHQYQLSWRVTAGTISLTGGINTLFCAIEHDR